MAVIKISRTVALDAPILTEALHGTLFTTEGSAHEFTIHCTQGGAAVTLSGTVTAKFIREESGDTILISGSLSSGAAKVTLPADCYHRSGRFSLTVFVTSGSVATVVYACTGTVKAAEDGTLIDEGTITPSYEQILQQLAGKVSKSGDTMSGDLIMRGQTYPMLSLKKPNGKDLGAFFGNTNNGRMIIRTWNSDSTSYVDYQLPDESDNNTSRVRYILTTKDFDFVAIDESDSGTLPGLVKSGNGVWLISVYDSTDAAKYWVGIAVKKASVAPAVQMLTNNTITYSGGNTLGTMGFTGATKYTAKALKIG